MKKLLFFLSVFLANATLCEHTVDTNTTQTDTSELQPDNRVIQATLYCVLPALAFANTFMLMRYFQMMTEETQQAAMGIEFGIFMLVYAAIVKWGRVMEYIFPCTLLGNAIGFAAAMLTMGSPTEEETPEAILARFAHSGRRMLRFRILPCSAYRAVRID